MLENFFSIYTNLLLVSIASLISEFAGVIAIFAEGVINLSAFLAIAFSIALSNKLLGMIFSCAICTSLLVFDAIYLTKTKSNPFIIGLSFNLFCDGIISILSTLWFNTRGVISFNDYKNISSSFVLSCNGVPFALFVLSIVVVALYCTRWGMRTQICGSDELVLIRYGINPNRYKIFSWIIAAALISVAGSLRAFKIQSYVPNISAGLGWIAIVCVYLGKKTTIGVFIAALVFSISEQYGIYLQGAKNLFVQIPQTVFISVPYIISLIFFIMLPKKN